ncbi:MAG TPA: BTAD domain-containing putative transcriptional regulator, partial [Gemmatimonadales bacterium]
MRLRTLAGLWIEADPPVTLGPRPLALLAMMAAAGRQGVSRDRVVGILWPEVDEERARHTLSQTLYTLRRDAGRPVVAGTTHLRLDPACSSDIIDLQDAARAGDLEQVADLYAGKFLDGFYLPGAPEFERWVEEERARVHQQAVRAFERLAREATEAGRREDAVRWWRRLADLDPLSTPYTLGHMRALADAGDRAGALARARAHREVVRWELETEPDPAVAEFVALLRSAPEPPPPVGPLPRLLPGAGRPFSTSARRASRWLVPLAFLAVLVAGLLFRDRGTRPELPFLAVGLITVEASADTGRFGPVLRDMLATSLGGIEGLQVVANSRLVELVPAGAEADATVIHDAAKRAGATEVIEGEVGTGPDGLVLALRRVTLAQGVVRKGYVVQAPDRYAAVDSAAAAIARDLGRSPPSVTVASVRTSSPAAYALYDEGLRALYGYDGAAAYRLMTAALARDSTFAMAAYYAWQLSRALADDSTTASALRLVQRLALRTI